LAAWAIPTAILESAPEPPYGFNPALFAPSPDAAEERDTPSSARAREVLVEGGMVIDVGAGGGAASLPLSPPAGTLVAIDESDEMLRSFAANAEKVGVVHKEILGPWPAVEGDTPVGEIVVCHHVLYNVPNLEEFSAALSRRARRRVTIEITATHPLVSQADLWRHFWGVDRPTGPTADAAIAVLANAGMSLSVERFQRRPRPGGTRADRVAMVRRRLCLPVEREPEVDELLGPDFGSAPRDVVTIWWDGTA